MQYIKTENSYSLSFYLFFLAVIFVYLNFVRNAFDVSGQLFSGPIRMASITAGPIFLLLSSIVALMEGQLRRIRVHYQWWIVCLIFLYLILLINGVFAHRNPIRKVSLDLMLFMFAIPGLLIGAKKINWVGFDKLICTIFIINTLILIPYIGSFGSLVEEIRTNIIMGFGMTPYFFWGGLLMWPYILLTLKDRSFPFKILCLLGIMLYFYFGIIYLKRIPFVHLAGLLLLLSISYRSNLKIRLNIKSILIFISFFAFCLFAFQSMGLISMSEKLVERFFSQGSIVNTLMQSDRLIYDGSLVASQLSGLEHIMGKGFGGTVWDFKHKYPELMTSSLHNGVALLWLKGGIVFSIVWYVGWLLLFKEFLFNKIKDLNQYYIPLLITVLLSWVFGFISMSVHFLLLTMCAGKLISKDNKV